MISRKTFWDILKYGYDRNKELRTNKDIVRAIKISQRLNKVIDPLGKSIVDITERVIKRKGYVQYIYSDDMQCHAIMIMLKSILRFDSTKSNNPYAYLVTCCHSACVNFIHKEKKQHSIKEELADRVLNGQVD